MMEIYNKCREDFILLAYRHRETLDQFVKSARVLPKEEYNIIGVELPSKPFHIIEYKVTEGYESEVTAYFFLYENPNKLAGDRLPPKNSLQEFISSNTVRYKYQVRRGVTVEYFSLRYLLLKIR